MILDTVLRNSTPEEISCTWPIKRVEMIRKEIEITRVHSLVPFALLSPSCILNSLFILDCQGWRVYIRKLISKGQAFLSSPCQAKLSEASSLILSFDASWFVLVRVFILKETILQKYLGKTAAQELKRSPFRLTCVKEKLTSLLKLRILSFFCGAIYLSPANPWLGLEASR